MYRLLCGTPPASYKADYFPRQFRLKEDVLKAAQEVLDAGGKLIRIIAPNGFVSVFDDPDSTVVDYFQTEKFANLLRDALAETFTGGDYTIVANDRGFTVKGKNTVSQNVALFAKGFRFGLKSVHL